MATILIVDDDAAMRDALSEAVRDLGHDPRTAVSGQAALTTLDHEAVNAVLLDLRMPGMDGLEVLRRIRSRPHPPVIRWRPKGLCGAFCTARKAKREAFCSRTAGSSGSPLMKPNASRILPLSI
jgi:CheY-like chemotaxis protein